MVTSVRLSIPNPVAALLRPRAERYISVQKPNIALMLSIVVMVSLWLTKVLPL